MNTFWASIIDYKIIYSWIWFQISFWAFFGVLEKNFEELFLQEKKDEWKTAETHQEDLFSREEEEEEGKKFSLFSAQQIKS